MCATFSRVSRDTAQGVETCVQVSQESHPSGTDGDRRRAVDRLHRYWRATAPLFCGADQGVQHVCISFFSQMNAWICERPTTDRDLASVIPDKKEKERE